MLVLDASGSMRGKIGGKSKIAIAREVIGDLMTGWDPTVELGLIAYGHRRASDCADIQEIVRVGPDSAKKISRLVNKLQPKGKTPLSAAITIAAKQLRYTEDAATVILVTDGLETCNADPCAVAQSLAKTGVKFTAHVIGFDVKEEESRSLRCFADATGGKYFSAKTAAELRGALGSAVEATKPRLSDKVRIALVEGGPLLDKGSAEFSFFAAGETGARPQKKLAGNDGYVGFAAVPVGKYVVRLKYGLARAEAPIEVSGEGKEHVVVLNAAILRVTAKLSDMTGSLADTLGWRIYPIGPDGKVAPKEITSALGKQAQFVLLPGEYLIKVALSGVKKSFTKRIAAGDQVDMDVDLRSGTLKFRAVLSDAGEQAKGHFKWDAYSLAADGHSRGDRLVFTVSSAGEFVLPAGKNLIAFSDRAIKREQIVDIDADKTLSFDFPMEAAVLKYKIVDASGAPIKGYPQIDIYPAGAAKTRANRLGYFEQVTDSVFIPAGPLDLVVQLKGKSKVLPIELRAGETRSLSVTLEGG